MKPRISMIVLAVTDIVAATKFYQDGLGLPLLDSPPNVAFFSLNGTWLGLSERNTLAKDIGLSSLENQSNGINLAHNVASEEEVKQVLKQAKNAGATIVKAAQKSDWGGFHGYFKDVDGHLWEVAYNPFMWVGPK